MKADRWTMVRVLVVAIPLLVLLIVLWVVPIELPYSIQAPGRVVSLKEWVLRRTQNGSLVCTLYDHVQGTIESYGTTEVARGDQMTVRLHPSLVDGTPVMVGDTVGVVYSTELERDWAQVHGELETERAWLRRAEAQGQPLQIVSRDEQIDVVRAHIAALQEEIEVLGKRAQASTLIAPISGRLVRFLSSDTLAVLQDTTGYAILSLVKWKDRAYVKPKQRVKLRIHGTRDRFSGTVRRVGHTAHVVNGQQMLGVVSTVREGRTNLSPGLIVHCYISCAPVRPLEYLWRFLTQ